MALTENFFVLISSELVRASQRNRTIEEIDRDRDRDDRDLL